VAVWRAAGRRYVTDLCAGANTICNSTISGNLQIQGSTHAPWQLGTCGTNTIGGNVSIIYNSGAGNSLTNTNIHGNLNCSGNADITGSNNKVDGQRSGQCATL
jgi:hypothetical protein